MNRYGLLAAAAGLLLLAAWGCSDDDNPPYHGDGQPPADAGDGGSGGDGIKQDGTSTDGFKCPMAGPCVLTKQGEGQHSDSYLVIGEVLTLGGTDLDTVTNVYVGAAEAPVLSVSATRVTCRIGPRTPPGQHTVEIKAGDTRRQGGVIEVRRLVVSVAQDDSKLTTFQSSTHSAGPEIGLGEIPEQRPRIGPTGRYVVSAGKTKLAVVDLALEQAATVSGLTEAVASWAIDDKGEELLLGTASGKLLTVDLTAFPNLSAAAVSGAPGTAAVSLVAPGLFVGLNPTASSGEGSLWQAKTDLGSFSWVQQGGTPFTIGSGNGLKGVFADSRDGFLAMLVVDGPSMHFAVAQVVSGTLKNPAAPAVAGGLYVTVAEGGSYVALSADEMTPTLKYLGAGAPTAVKTVALGSGGASRVIAGALPTIKDLVFALVGPMPAPSAVFKAATIELADLAQGKRLTLSGGNAAVELADMRDAVADPIADRLHVITGTHFHTFNITLSGGTLTVAEQHPYQQLPAGKTHRWLAIQP